MLFRSPKREMGSIKSGDAAATKNGQDKKRGRCRNENWAKKSGALLQREMGSIKCGGTAVTRNGQYKKPVRCRNEIGRASCRERV